MKHAMMTVVAILTTVANAADYGTCNHADLHPTDIGYSVSALRLAEDEERGRKVAPPRPSDCGPTSIGYSVSARRMASESPSSNQSESYASSSPSYGSSILDGSAGYYPASNHRGPVASRSPNYVPIAPGYAVRSDYPILAPMYSRVAVPIYSPYSRPHNSAPQHALPQHQYAPSPYPGYSTGHGPNYGKKRVGGVGSSGKGSHYRRY